MPEDGRGNFLGLPFQMNFRSSVKFRYAIRFTKFPGLPRLLLTKVATRSD